MFIEILESRRLLATFTNPIGMGADPWVTFHNGYYYYAHGEDAMNSQSIWVHKSPRLQDVVNAPAVKVWQSPPDTAYTTQVWAPELHRLDGRWYIYFTASAGSWYDHRMYTLAANGTNPQGQYTFKGKIAAATDHHAIDGSVLNYDGQRYMIWSGWDTPTSSNEQRVYIARMSSPTTIAGDRVELSRPTYPWELVYNSRVNEGPTALVHGDDVFITYSTANYWNSEYALGMLAFQGGDVMNPANWVKHPSPVFSQGNGVSGVGHASFTKSPDGQEDWIVFHSWVEALQRREVHTKRFTWNTDGTPDFGAPVGRGVPMQEPAGTPRVALFAISRIADTHDELEGLLA